MLSYYNTVTEIEKSGVDTAIIPVGSIEQHGSHLPIGTDYFSADAISKAVAERMDALLYPTIPFSTCYEHKGTKGTLCMRPSTFYQMVQDLVLNLREQGFKKVIFIISHGGVFIAGPAIRELNALYDDLQVALVFGANQEKIKNEILECKQELHAGEKETSMMLYLQKETVNKEEMMKNDFVPDCPREFLNYAPLPVLSKTGVWGRPSLASEEKGKKIFEYIVDGIIENVEKIFEIGKSEKW